MRLTTLARKIDKTPSQLIAYLTEKNIEVPNGIHSKLDKEVAESVLSEFIDDVEEIIDEDEVVTNELAVSEELSGEEIKENVEEKLMKTEISEGEENLPEAAEKTEELKTATIEDLESEHFEEVDLIKAKKVKLEGIKVVGKIDLPEKPKKVETEEVEEVAKEKDKSKAKKEPRKFDRNRKKNRNAKNRKSLSYEERLKEEEREKLKLRRRRENAERKRKQKFYEENIKPKNVQKLKNRKQQNLKENSAVVEKKVVVHKNPIKRLWAWLNGEYDKY